MKMQKRLDSTIVPGSGSGNCEQRTNHLRCGLRQFAHRDENLMMTKMFSTKIILMMTIGQSIVSLPPDLLLLLLFGDGNGEQSSATR